MSQETIFMLALVSMILESLHPFSDRTVFSLKDAIASFLVSCLLWIWSARLVKIIKGGRHGTI